MPITPKDLDCTVAEGAVKKEERYGQEAKERGIKLRPKYTQAGVRR